MLIYVLFTVANCGANKPTLHSLKVSCRLLAKYPAGDGSAKKPSTEGKDYHENQIPLTWVSIQRMFLFIKRCSHFSVLHEATPDILCVLSLLPHSNTCSYNAKVLCRSTEHWVFLWQQQINIFKPYSVEPCVTTAQFTAFNNHFWPLPNKTQSILLEPRNKPKEHPSLSV